MELRNACQCCLLRPLDKDLKKCYRRLDQKEVYSDMLEECFEIQLWSSGLEVEAGICEICVSRLRDACDFKRQVVRCQRKLQAAVKEEGEDDDKDEVVVVMVDSDIEFLDDDIKSESPDSPEPCSSPDYLEDSKPESKAKPAGIPRTTGVTVKRTLEKRRRSSADDSVKDEDVKRKPLSQEKSDLAKLLGLPKSDITVRPTRAEGPKTRAQRAIAKTPTTTQKPVPLRINLPAAKKPVKVTPKPTPKTPPKSKSADEVKVRKRKSAAALAAVKAHEANVRTLIQHSNCTPFLTRTIAGIQCCYCEANFSNLAPWREHMQSEHSNDEYRAIKLFKKHAHIAFKMDTTDLKCNFCEQNFEILSSLKEHLTNEHDVKFIPEEKNYVIEFKLSDGDVMNCALCSASFESFKTLLQHMNIHYRNFICEECDAGFINEGKWLTHQKTHVKGTFACSFCSKVFLTAVRLNSHEKSIHMHAARVRTRKCPLCEKTFTTYHIRNRHLLDDHNSTAATYKCNICDQVFLLKMYLSNHIRKVHLMERSYKCSECGMDFFTKRGLQKHMIKHNGERIHKCTECGKAYARKDTLRQHMRIHNNDQRYKCELCGSAFVQKGSMKSHMLSYHGVVLEEFEQGIQCCYCQENFFNLALLREHMQLAHSNDEYRGMDAAKHRNNTSCKMDTTDLKCTLCEQNFDLLSSLKEHLIMEHDVKFTPEESNYIIEFKLSNEGEVMNCALCNYKCEAFKTLLIHMNRHCRNFICEECDIGFVNEHRLRMHKKTHRIGNFECSFCPKVFLTSVALERHENCSHKNPNVIRRRKCPLCEKTFPSYYVRNRHILDDHNSSAAAYKCSICNQIFVLKMHLSNHIRKVHLMERNHKCSECEMSFFSRKSLNRHMVRHNGERIYKCTVCNKAYARIFTLKEHMRIHNNDRRFKCELCGSTFIQKCTLKSHMLSNHDVVLAEFEQNKRS